MRLSTGKVETLAPWMAGLVLSCPVLIAYYPPMTDLPHHEAAIGLLRHFGDASMFPPGLYELNLGEPNQLFHMLGWALAYAMPTRWAVKLIVAAAVIAVPVCAARFARYVGASPLAALVVAPMALGWVFSLGLVANLIGLAALLAVLPVVDRLAREPMFRGALDCLAAAVLLYFAHEAMLFVYAGAALALALLHPWSRKGTTLRLVPFAISMVIVTAQALWQKRLFMSAWYDSPLQYDSLLRRLAIVPTFVVQSNDTPTMLAMTSLCVLAIASFFWLRTRERRAAGSLAGSSPAPETARAKVRAYRWEIFALVSFAAYLAFPFSLNGATFVYQRWFSPGFAVLAVIAAPRDLWSRAARVPRLVAVTLPLAALLAAIPAFADSSREYEALDEVIGRIEPCSSLAGIDLGPLDPSRTYNLGAATGRVLATRGGRLAYGLTYSTVSPVVPTRQHAWANTSIRLGADPWMFSPTRDFGRFRYLLMHASDADLARAGVRAVRAEAKYIATAGEWMLFESKMPVVSMLSVDASVLFLDEDTLRKRILALLPIEIATHAPGATENQWPDPQAE